MSGHSEADLTVPLPDREATERLGRVLAQAALLALERGERPPALLLSGPLGAGKTTLVRGLVLALPGAEEAEPASPSFNLANLYPTRPVVAHFDLYRLEEGGYLDDTAEWLESPGVWPVVEWAERLPPVLRPAETLRIRLIPDGTGRRAEFAAESNSARAYLASLGSLHMEASQAS